MAAHKAFLFFTISWSLLKLISIKLMMPSNHLILYHYLSSCLQSFPASWSFLMSQLFTSDGQSIGASASVLPVNIQDWFPLGLTGWISLQSQGLSRASFSNITVWKHQFFSAERSNSLWTFFMVQFSHSYTTTYGPSLWSNSHIHTWLLEKPQPWLDGPLSTNWNLCFLICCLALS